MKLNLEKPLLPETEHKSFISSWVNFDYLQHGKENF